MRVRQADWQPEHLVVHGVGVVDLVSVGGAPRAEVVVRVGTGAGALLDEEEANDAGAVRERAAAVLVVAPPRSPSCPACWRRTICGGSQ